MHAAQQYFAPTRDDLVLLYDLLFAVIGCTFTSCFGTELAANETHDPIRVLKALSHLCCSLGSLSLASPWLLRRVSPQSLPL